MHRLSLARQKFDQLTVIRSAGTRSRKGNRKESVWLCKCSCGKTTKVVGSKLTSGHTRSCGCLKKTCCRTHGLSSTLAAKSWYAMISRCNNPKDKDYPRWGGRGVRVCRRWLKLENFIADMGERPSKRHSIERRDNDGNYCKSNCYWALPIQQMSNRRVTVYLTYKGKRRTIRQWADKLGQPYQLLANRYQQGWPVKHILTMPKFGKVPQCRSKQTGPIS